MSIRVNKYQYDKICDQMKREFGAVKRGEEEQHAMVFFSMEGNLLKTHRAHPSSDSRRLLEAIPLVLFHLMSHLTGEEYDLDGFKSEDNERLAHALLMAFDPFTNEEIRVILEREETIDLADRDQLKAFYHEPIMCVLKIRESAESWTKRYGANGYFNFTEEFLGKSVGHETELKFTISLGGFHEWK